MTIWRAAMVANVSTPPVPHDPIVVEAGRRGAARLREIGSAAPFQPRRAGACSAFDESEQIGIDGVRIHGRHAVGEPRIDLELALAEEVDPEPCAVVDGVDGCTHHIKLPDLDAAGDSASGSIVELRRFEDNQGQRRVAIAIRSDLDIDRQISASGATWLDRQNIAREPAALSQGGFGAEVRQALERRADHLVRQGFGERHGQRVTFTRNLIDTLRRRELEALGDKLAAETGQPFNRAASGEYVAGSYRQRFTLASGRFAMLDDGLGFQLVPWTPSLEKQLGKHVSGVARDDGGIDWSFGRQRGLGL